MMVVARAGNSHELSLGGRRGVSVYAARCARDLPIRQITSVTGVPVSARFRANEICSSVYVLIFTACSFLSAVTWLENSHFASARKTRKRHRHQHLLLKNAAKVVFCEARDRPERGHISDQYSAPVYGHHLASAVGLAHQVEEGFCDLGRLAYMADGEFRAGLTDQGFADVGRNRVP